MSFQAGTPGAIQAPPATAGHLGQGISYPLSYDSKGRLALASGPRAVEQAILSICQTQPGERPMEPDYGGGSLVFEPLDPDRVRDAIERTIADHEPRVQDVTIDVEQGQDAGTSMATIGYRIVGVARRTTQTVPFYIGPNTTSAAGT